ncbi:MAG: peptide chain release factor N(5)-glutamine methyltransferase [Ekhidna sp.]|nr:peptide chain release factor N(5)-glutamine methyltransferase [Ekhidna sp.]MBC6410684.1 peptide chain release factor N(5)-glutamine methyltransferase [Ekhidna sp.]
MDARQIWEETSKQLEKVYARREAENISYLLLEDLLMLRKADILTGMRKDLKEKALSEAIERMLQNEPLQYVTGIAHFYGRKFKIKEGVLIPRPETEELVDLIIKENNITEPKILDVGVGSGCIGITLALETKGKVTGTDISEDALSVASANASLLEASIIFKKNDILYEESGEKQLDILVSNPPYIPESDRHKVHANVSDNEPDAALFVSDEAPLIFYKRIGEEGKRCLKTGGKLYFEIHEQYGNEVKNLLETLDYRQVSVHKDMQGKDRMVSAIN